MFAHKLTETIGCQKDPKASMIRALRSMYTVLECDFKCCLSSTWRTSNCISFTVPRSLSHFFKIQKKLFLYPQNTLVQSHQVCISTKWLIWLQRLNYLFCQQPWTNWHSSQLFSQSVIFLGVNVYFFVLSRLIRHYPETLCQQTMLIVLWVTGFFMSLC